MKKIIGLLLIIGLGLLAGCGGKKQPDNRAVTLTLTSEGETVGTYRLSAGSEFTFPELTRPGFKLDHWVSRADGTRHNGQITVREPAHYDAVWYKACIISFDTNGGDERFKPISAYEHDVIRLPEPTKAGHRPTAWKDQDGNEFTTTLEVTGNTHLTVDWHVLTYQVRFICAAWDEPNGTQWQEPLVQELTYLSVPTFDWDQLDHSGARSYYFRPRFAPVTAAIDYIGAVTAKTPNLTFALEDDHYVVTGLADQVPKIIIPAFYRGLPVTKIGERAFENHVCEAVELPETVKIIGKSAFEGCANLTKINLDFVEYLSDSCFKGCRALNHFVVGPNVTYIEMQAFYSCGGMETLTIHQGTALAEHVFDWCTKLHTIYTEAGNVVALQAALNEQLDNGKLIYVGGGTHNNFSRTDGVKPLPAA